MNENNNPSRGEGSQGSNFYKNPRTFTRSKGSSNNKPIEEHSTPKAEMAKSAKRDSKKKLSEMISSVVMGIIGVVIIALIIMGAKRLYENNIAPDDTASSSILTQSGLTEVLRATPDPVIELEWATEQSIEGLAIESYDSLVTVGGSAYPYFKFNGDRAVSYIKAINSLYDSTKENVDFYNIIYPSAIDIMLPLSFLESYADETSDQNKTIQYINSQLNSGVKSVSLYDVFKSHCDLDLYFGTDSRPTSLSAYYMYQTWAKEKGIKPISVDDMEKVTFTGFLGNIYQSTKLPALSESETMIVYQSPADLSATYLEDGTMKTCEVYTDVSEYSSTYKYSTFLFNSSKYTEIVNNGLDDGSACLIVADDNANAFAPYVANHYQYTYLVNYENYTGGIEDIIAEKNITDVICLSGIDATRQQASIDKLEGLLE